MRNKYIGRVVISRETPATTDRVYAILLDKNAEVSVGSTYLVAEDENTKLLCLPVDAYSTSASKSAVEECFASDCDPNAPDNGPEVVTVYALKIIRANARSAPRRRLWIRPANEDDFKFFNYNPS